MRFKYFDPDQGAIYFRNRTQKFKIFIRNLILKKNSQQPILLNKDIEKFNDNIWKELESGTKILTYKIRIFYKINKKFSPYEINKGYWLIKGEGKKFSIKRTSNEKKIFIERTSNEKLMVVLGILKCVVVLLKFLILYWLKKYYWTTDDVRM